MNDTSFNSQVDGVFLDIEERVDELADDIDIDSSGGVLTFTFQDGSNVILSRQVGSHEIWVAAKFIVLYITGYHPDAQKRVW